MIADSVRETCCMIRLYHSDAAISQGWRAILHHHDRSIAYTICYNQGTDFVLACSHDLRFKLFCILLFRNMKKMSAASIPSPTDRTTTIYWRFGTSGTTSDAEMKTKPAALGR